MLNVFVGINIVDDKENEQLEDVSYVVIDISFNCLSAIITSSTIVFFHWKSCTILIIWFIIGYNIQNNMPTQLLLPEKYQLRV